MIAIVIHEEIIYSYNNFHHRSKESSKASLKLLIFNQSEKKKNYIIGILIITVDAEAMPYFYIPIGLLLLSNMTLFIITAVNISRYQQTILASRGLARNLHSDREDQRLFRKIKRTFVVCLVLFFLMGLNWMMELVSWFAVPLDWSAFDLVNALQGVIVFGLFILRKPARNFVWHRIQKLRGIHTTEPNVGI